MAQLRFFYGPMDCGKSTLALQMEYNLASRGKQGLVLVIHDRSGSPQISSRIGLTCPALEVTPELNIYDLCTQSFSAGKPLDYVVVDEAQFLTPAQVEELCHVVDELNVEVSAYGIATDFRSELFPGAKRLFELADVRTLLQVETLCWCGAVGQQNARVENGKVTLEGAVAVVGDTAPDASVHYQVLCRKHFFARELPPKV